MKRYLVGSAVRDALLGRPLGDRDWVVVGASPDEMRAAGFLAVGRDFPVFLDPQTREEHALARTERKTGPGYHGFEFHADPGVTLEDDLARRRGGRARARACLAGSLARADGRQALADVRGPARV